MPAGGLGRIPEFDEASKGYRIRALLSDVPLVNRVWDLDRFLNQWETPECVGYGLTHEILSTPVVPVDPYLIDSAYATMIYNRAQKVDEWPGEDYEGTSVLAGAKVLLSLGWYSEYRWGFGLQDALDTLSQWGPVVIGVNWYDGMDDTDSAGMIHATGSIRGGHAILVRAINVEAETVMVHNSWGADWGWGGVAWMSWSDLGKLLAEDGECLVPIIRTVPGDGPTPPQPKPLSWWDKFLAWLYGWFS